VATPNPGSEDSRAAGSRGFTAQLSRLPVFEGVDAAALALLTPQMVRAYRSGRHLLKQGHLRRALFVILKGTVEIRRWQTDDRRGHDVLLGTRGPASVLGEQSFIEGRPHSADVIALNDVEALEIEPDLADELLRDATFARNLLRIESEKLREASEQRYKLRSEGDLLYATVESHLSAEIASQIISSGSNITTPRRVEIITLMADIRGFTGLSAHLDPMILAPELGAYLGRMSQLIIDGHGMVDKYIGDAIMGIWGFARLYPNTAAATFGVAESMVSAASTMTIGGVPVRIGVGLAIGEVFIGNVGSDGKRQFTVIGDSVNRAARYESQTKDLHVDVAMSAAFRARLTDEQRFRLTEHAGITMHNVPEPETLYGLSIGIEE
jgi:class 3 adenylate cyclase